jgi:CBS domain-containing protein
MADIRSILSNDYVRTDSNDTLTSLLGKLIGTKQTEALVFDGDTYVGMFANQRLPKPHINSADVKVHSLTEPAPTLSSDDDVLVAAQRMFESGHSVLPVIDTHVLGVVDLKDVLAHLRNIPETRGVRVADIRHPQPITLHKDDGIGKVFPLVREQRIDHFPVLDDDGTVTGFLGLSDILSFYLQPQHRDRGMAPRSTSTRGFQGEKPHLVQLPVSNFMNTRHAVTIAEQSSLREAIDAMLSNNVHSLLLLRDDKPYGIVAARDVLEAVIATQVKEATIIQYKGLRELDIDAREEEVVKKICSYYAEKIGHHVHNEFQVIVHLKQRSSTGKRHRYTASTRVITPGGPIVATEARDWDVRTALHKSFQELEGALEHQFKQRYTPSVKKLAARSDNDNLPGELSA